MDDNGVLVVGVAQNATPDEIVAVEEWLASEVVRAGVRGADGLPSRTRVERTRPHLYTLGRLLILA